MKSILFFILLSFAVSANAQTHECAGITTKNVKCKRKIAGSAVYCWQHDNAHSKPRLTAQNLPTGRQGAITVKTAAHQCLGRTQKGLQCKRKITTGNFCYQHAK